MNFSCNQKPLLVQVVSQLLWNQDYLREQRAERSELSLSTHVQGTMAACQDDNLCLHSCVHRFRKVVGYRGEKPQLARGGRIWICCEECLKSVDNYNVFAASPGPKHLSGTIWASRQECCHIEPGRLLLMHGYLFLFSRKRWRTIPTGAPPFGWPCTALLDGQSCSAAPSATWPTCWALLGHCAFLALSRASRIQPIIQIPPKR